MAPAILLFAGDSRESSIFHTASLMRGSITDLDPACYRDMQLPHGLDGDAPSVHGAGLSRNQRLQFLPRASFKAIFKAAFDGLTAITDPAIAKNEKGQPLAAICMWQPFSDAAPGALLDLQREASIKPQQSCDVRGLILDTKGSSEQSKATLLSEVVDAWSKNELQIQGHPKTNVRAFAENAELQKFEHVLSFVDSFGKLQPAEAHLNKFLGNPTTAAEAEDFLCNWQAQAMSPQAPVWLSAPTLGCARVPEPIASKPLPAGYNSLQELLADTFIGECGSHDAAIRLVVNHKHEGWAHVLKDITRAEGAKEVSFGRGKRLDKASMATFKDHTAVPIEVTEDAAPVFFKQDPAWVKLLQHPSPTCNRSFCASPGPHTFKPWCQPLAAPCRPTQP